LSQFAEEQFGEDRRSRRKQPDVKQVVRYWISRSVQLELLVIDANHHFVKQDLIRKFPRSGL
jgi:hypothetical protein